MNKVILRVNPGEAHYLEQAVKNRNELFSDVPAIGAIQHERGALQQDVAGGYYMVTLSGPTLEGDDLYQLGRDTQELISKR